MGQEWAARAPFLYFTDHHPELGRLVTEGRRQEFGRFEAFSNSEARLRIPDPQAEETFLASRLDWGELESADHAALHRLYRALLALRRDHPALEAGGSHRANPADEGTVVLRRTRGPDAMLCVVRLTGAGTVTIDESAPWSGTSATPWISVLSTEDPAFSTDPMPPVMDWSGGRLVVTFARPGAVVLGSHSGGVSA
jgi:maltooligosyltrehalose trehalohydrolase